MNLFTKPKATATGWVALLTLTACPAFADATGWKKHVIAKASFSQINSAIAHDWDGDGHQDVITSYDNKVVILRGPDWSEYIVDRIVQGRSRQKVRTSCMHSCLMDVDRDGDLDFIGSNNTVFWLECPDGPFSDKAWTHRAVDDEILGTHCLLTGDVNLDGKPDLIANSGRANRSEFSESLVWLEAPADLRASASWTRHIYAATGTAPRGSHYAGFGDVNADGRPDIAYGAKGVGKPPKGGWFAWWEQPADPSRLWKKHLLADDLDGATNILPADLDGDEHVDYFATRGHAQGVLWFRGPSFEKIDIDRGMSHPHSLDLADIDGDGDLDAVTCSKDEDGLTAWFENSGKGVFARHVIGRGQGSYDTRCVDLDKDGDLDVLIAGHVSKNVVWFENPRRP